MALGPGPSSTYHGLHVGNRIVALSTDTYAQYACVPAKYSARLPAEISFDTGCAALTQGLTALTMIKESYDARTGDWILVHAAAGGVGLWLCQLLKVVGARVIATASTQEKLLLASDNGAEVLINYSREDVLAKVLEVTDREGVAGVFDGVGKSTYDLSLSCLARRGTMVSFGNASGVVPPFAIARLGDKNLKLCRPRLFAYIETREEFDQYTNELFQLMVNHKLNVLIHKTYPLSEAAKAHEVRSPPRKSNRIISGNAVAN